MDAEHRDALRAGDVAVRSECENFVELLTTQAAQHKNHNVVWFGVWNGA
jgi:hypothetical protein